MTIEDFEKEVKGMVDWMKDSTTIPPESTDDKDNDTKTVLEDIESNYDSDVYEVYVDYHLTNGEVVKTRNHCLESYYRRQYVGDNAFLYDGWLYIEYDTDDGKHHQSRVKPESVCWIDSYNAEIDWKSNALIILRELRLM